MANTVPIKVPVKINKGSTWSGSSEFSYPGRI